MHLQNEILPVTCWKLHSNTRPDDMVIFINQVSRLVWVYLECWQMGSLSLCCLLFIFCTGMNLTSAKDTAGEVLLLCVLRYRQQPKWLSPGLQENPYCCTDMVVAFCTWPDVPPCFSSTHYTHLRTKWNGRKEKITQAIFSSFGLFSSCTLWLHLPFFPQGAVSSFTQLPPND